MLIGAGLLGCRFPEQKHIGERPRATVAVAKPRAASHDRRKCSAERTSQRGEGRQPPAGRRQGRPVRPLRGAPRDKEYLGPVRPYAKVGPKTRSIDFHPGLRNPFLRDIAFAGSQETAQPHTPYCGAVKQSAARESVHRLEHEVAFSLGKHVHIVYAQHMRHGHMGAQDSTLFGVDPVVAVPLRQG